MNFIDISYKVRTRCGSQYYLQYTLQDTRNTAIWKKDHMDAMEQSFCIL